MRATSAAAAGRHRAGPPSRRSVGRHRARRRSSGRRRAGAAAAIAGGVVAVGGGLSGDWGAVLSAAEVRPGVAEAEERDPVVDGLRPVDAAGVPRARAMPDDVARGSLELAPRSGDRDDAISRSGGRGSAPDDPAWLTACGNDEVVDGYNNGGLPVEDLCALPVSGHRLLPTAARAWWQLNERYQAEFGSPMCLTDSYRDLAQQQALAATKPGLAAEPGTSNHGWATALDVCGGVESFGSPQYEWLGTNATRWGWENPVWARVDGSRPEPWHWEFVGR